MVFWALRDLIERVLGSGSIQSINQSHPRSMWQVSAPDKVDLKKWSSGCKDDDVL